MRIDGARPVTCRKAGQNKSTVRGRNAYITGVRFCTVAAIAVTTMTMTTRVIDKCVWQSSRSFFFFQPGLSAKRGSARMEYICENNSEFSASNKGGPACNYLLIDARDKYSNRTAGSLMNGAKADVANAGCRKWMWLIQRSC